MTQNTTKQCFLDTFINHSNTPSLAKAIYQNNHWDFSNNAASLALLDSLNTSSLASLAFYIKVIGLTYKKADGFYAEALGLAAKELVENHTTNFAKCISNKACFNDKELQDWAEMVMIELALIAENSGDTSNINSFIKHIKNGCINCTPNDEEVLTEFIHLLSKSPALQ